MVAGPLCRDAWYASHMPLPQTFALLLFLLLPLAGSAAQQHPQDPPLRAPDTWIDDDLLNRQFLEGAKALFEAGKAPSMENLLAGLAEESCNLKLPEVPARSSGGAHGGMLDTESLYGKALGSVAVVGSLYTCPRCSELHVSSATGFFLTPEGALVTNYHVVNKAENKALFAMTADGRVFPVIRTLAGNEQADVAIVQVDPVDQHGKRATLATLPLASQSRTGQNVRVVSHADSRHYTLTQGIVSRRYVQEGGTQWITITADYAKGSSGGPLFNDAGEVIGIVASTSSVYYSQDGSGHGQNLQMVWKQCVPVENIRRLIRQGA